MWLWFKEKMPNGLDVAIVLAPLTALGYGLTYAYYYGFYDVYRIPSMFIEIDIMKLTQTILILISAISLIIINNIYSERTGISFSIFSLFSYYKKVKFWFEKRSNSSVENIEKSLKNSEKKSHAFKFIPTIFIGFSLMFIVPYINWLTIFGLGILSQGLIGLYRHFKFPKIGIVIYLLFALFLLSYLLGTKDASNKNEYLVISNKNEEFLILDTYKGKLIAAPYNKKEIIPDYKLIEAGKDIEGKSLTLTYTGVLNTLKYKGQKEIHKPLAFQVKEFIYKLIFWNRNYPY
jgi:hypothetical protein